MLIQVRQRGDEFQLMLGRKIANRYPTQEKAVKALTFYMKHDRLPPSDAEADAYIARLATADIAAGIE